jgi:hypothetical protein
LSSAAIGRLPVNALHDSWNWTAGKQLLATGSFRCTAGIGVATLSATKGRPATAGLLISPPES